MGILLEYLQQEAKGKPVEEYLLKTSQNAKKCKWATHIGRFTHPASNVAVNDTKSGNCNGYVSNASVQSEIDIATSANYLATAKLLTKKMPDGRTVYRHIKEDADFLKRELGGLNVDCDEIRKNMLAIETDYTPQETDDKLKQVYFPVQDDDYHLLTVLPPSCVMVELRRRLRQMEEQAWKARKNEIAANEYREIYDIAVTAIGGTKPQNISMLNNAIGGKLYLLPSFPPMLQSRDVREPREDFFGQSLSIKSFEWLFEKLHAAYAAKRNNRELRSRIRELEYQVMDTVMLNVFALRNLQPGWSNAENKKLPEAQRIWLDNEYAARRTQEADWQREIAEEFARWFIKTYELTVREMNKKKSENGKAKGECLVPVSLGDAEMTALEHGMLDCIADTLTMDGEAGL